ncbi:VOC family protein [Actinoplanes sp. NBRC 103695]|uniref:VOC family protein n=1 Tax=Actinoplanes sp. NBRC 103695 TaxID=3032202 RepID=UPI0024A561B0|nr:VOC family protein [Actinoplanes sp. NBRC 103695]GLZ01160.1 hypothetical protein Acsp02_84110 [Actinoplanes sp. NBRC 103695]
MILGIDHVGLRLADPAAAHDAFVALGMGRTDSGSAEAFGVNCEFWGFSGEAPFVELVAPAVPDSAVSGPLEREGPGLYHIAFTVDDLDIETRRLRTNGFSPVRVTPCAGARKGMTVTFLYLRQPVGLLIELVHYADPSH